MSIERRETATGGVRWDVRLRRPDGSAYKRTFRTKKEAERFQATELADKSRGTWVDPQAGRTTVAQWFEEWYATNSHSWRPSTAAKNRSAVVKHWLPRLGAREVGGVTPRHVQRVVNELVGEGLNPTTVRSYYGAFSALMNSAVDMELIGRTPCRGVKLPAVDSEEKRVVTPTELHALADAIGPEWRAMIYLAGVMGLRFGEVAALQVQDVDLDERVLSITKSVAEGGGHLQDRSNQDSGQHSDTPAPRSDGDRAAEAHRADGPDGSRRSSLLGLAQWTCPIEQLPRSDLRTGRQGCCGRRPHVPRPPPLRRHHLDGIRCRRPHRATTARTHRSEPCPAALRSRFR